MTMIFLQWEKAFDKVYQDEVINAVRRMNIPEKMVSALETFYDNPRFRIKDMAWKEERRLFEEERIKKEKEQKNKLPFPAGAAPVTLLR